jgi:acetyl esterase/lipase
MLVPTLTLGEIIMRAHCNLYSALIVILLVIAIPRPLQAEARVESNVIYGMYSGLALLMDVHYPTNPNGYGIIVIPGSGFRAPMSLDARPLKERVGSAQRGADALLESGYTLFSINHRASPRFQYPSAVEDAQRAVRYIRHNAARYGINPDRIGALGDSSGGHLVSMMGVLDGNGNPEDPSLINRESSKVQAVVAIFPATDFIEAVNGNVGAISLMTEFFGTYLSNRQIQQNPHSEEVILYREASPTTYVSSDDPPFLLIHGDEDTVVPFSQSELFQEELIKSGVTVELIRVPGGGHGASILVPNAPDYFGPMVELFDRYLRNKR